MAKSADAFRTISEVADWLGVQAHVLRFWESKFAQVKPIKRAGGRRYYRPADMLLLGGIKKLLHGDGLTIKGAQKLLRENGVAFVADQSQPLDDLTMAVIEGSPAQEDIDEVEDLIDTDAPSDVEEEAALGDQEALLADADVSDEPEPEPEPEPEAPEMEEPSAEADLAEPEPLLAEPEELVAVEGEHATSEAETAAPEDEPEAPAPAMPSFRARPRGDDATPAPTEDDAPENAEAGAPQDAPHEPDVIPAAMDDITPEAPAFTPSEAPPPPKPRIIDLPPIPDAADIDVSPSALTALGTTKRLSTNQVQSIRPLLARLTRLRASMGNPRKEIRKD